MAITNSLTPVSNVVGSRQRIKRGWQRGRQPLPLDEKLITALESGFPDCAGVALGFDRLLMVATGAAAITDVRMVD